MQYFWSNTIWYIVLGIITIIELLYVLVKATDRKIMLALFFTFSGIVYIIEIQVLILLKGYDYFPKIVNKISTYDDNIMGNMFSQFSIAATALLVSFLKLKPYWYVICSIVYGGIEEVFLYLGIYKHNWYRTWMTVTGFPLILWMLNKIYKKIFKTAGRIFKYIVTFFAVYALFIFVFSWSFRLLGHVPFNRHVFSDEDISTIFCSSVNYIIVSNIIMISYYKRLRWQWHILIIAILYIYYYLVYLFDFIIYTDIKLLLIFATVQISGMYLCIFAADRLYDQVDSGTFYKPGSRVE